MPGTVFQNFGSVGGYTVTANRRASQPADNVGGRSTIAMTLTKGGDVREVCMLEDDVAGSSASVIVGRALVAAFAAIGGSVTLGAPGQAGIPAGGTANKSTYANAAVITPGTPVPPGRGVYVRPAGGVEGLVVLKLAGGGTLTVSTYSGRIDGLAVVDYDAANSQTGCEVTVLY